MRHVKKSTCRIVLEASCKPGFVKAGQRTADKIFFARKFGYCDKKYSISDSHVLLSSHLSNPAITGRNKRSYPGVGGQRQPPLFDLAPDGVCQARKSPFVRWALTPPFHPYRKIGGVFSVALSLSSHPQEFLLHPALWSPDFPPAFPPVAGSDTSVSSIA